MKRIGMRRLAAFAAAAALVLCLVGCGGAQSTAQGNTEPVDLSVWTYYNGDQLESFNKLVDTFNDTVGKEKMTLLLLRLMVSTLAAALGLTVKRKSFCTSRSSPSGHHSRMPSNSAHIYSTRKGSSVRSAGLSLVVRMS